MKIKNEKECAVRITIFTGKLFKDSAKKFSSSQFVCLQNFLDAILVYSKSKFKRKVVDVDQIVI